MRIRAAATALTGALALTTLTGPASGPVAAAQGPGASTRVTGVDVNGGKDIVVGSTAKKHFTMSVRAEDSAGIRDAYAWLWRGNSAEHIDGMLYPDTNEGSCADTAPGAAVCTLRFTVDPTLDLQGSNHLAGDWQLYVEATARDDGYASDDRYRTVRLKRAARLATDAAPEAVRPGKPVKVTADLRRADWNKGRDAAYGGQRVTLQRKDGGSWTSVKSVRTGAGGEATVTVRPTRTTTYRYTYGGTSTTAPTTSAPTTVAVP
ncbi:hypothetical protein [Streptomyces uncialis]|uniref:hypothetical protein n=1 Tax=Streptomyces uncialis TaxID=1048205 RepID=UPI0037AF6235